MAKVAYVLFADFLAKILDSFFNKPHNHRMEITPKAFRQTQIFGD